jgi:hypothetical protein
MAYAMERATRNRTRMTSLEDKNTKAVAPVPSSGHDGAPSRPAGADLHRDWPSEASDHRASSRTGHRRCAGRPIRQSHGGRVCNSSGPSGTVHPEGDQGETHLRSLRGTVPAGRPYHAVATSGSDHDRPELRYRGRTCSTWTALMLQPEAAHIYITWRTPRPAHALPRRGTEWAGSS